MKKIIAALMFLSLTGCAAYNSIFMAEYDSNEYGLVNKVRTISQLKRCDVYTLEDLYMAALELKNFSEYLPRNEKTIDMNTKLFTLIDELHNRKQPISTVFCEAKLKLIEVNAENIQSVTGKRPR